MTVVWWSDPTDVQKYEKSQEVREWLLSQRLSNYGYDWKNFRNLSNKASRLRRKVRGGDFHVRANHGIMESWNHGIMESWNHGIMESWNHGSLELGERES